MRPRRDGFIAALKRHDSEQDRYGIPTEKLSNSISFDLGEDTFNFAFRDSSGCADIDLDYADMPEKSSGRIERQDWWRNVGLLWVVIGVVQAGTALMSEAGLKAIPFWLLLGAASIAWYYYSTVR